LRLTVGRLRRTPSVRTTLFRLPLLDLHLQLSFLVSFLRHDTPPSLLTTRSGQLTNHGTPPSLLTTRSNPIRPQPQALSQLDHANIVRVYDQREIAEPPTILLYMQYLAGGTLADCIKHARSEERERWSGQLILDSIDRRLLDASQTVPEQSTVRLQITGMEWAEVVAWFGIQLAEGLDYANSKGVLHRDVKPANILLSAEAIPKLADFNVSCSGLSGRAGAAAYFGGSLAYMSPEQLQVADPTDGKTADQLDGRSDLYALGIVLWELWQGRRPWTLNQLAASWTDAVKMQREIRTSPIEMVHQTRSATERALERTVLSLLSVDPNDRPQSGKETAARLRLAFYPELAERFEPEPRSMAGRLLRLPVLLISALLIFGPNIAASVFNYEYNERRMQADTGCDEDQQRLLDSARIRLLQQQWNLPPTPDPVADAAPGSNPPVIEDRCSKYRFFKNLSFLVNFIVFPLGGVLFLLTIWPFVKIVHRGKRGQAARPSDLSYLWTIGYRATLICAVLWAVSGIVFAASMSLRFDDFRGPDAFHFFISLILCGGVAWIYPYYGMTLLSLLVYYPTVVAPSMNDPDFDSRSRRIRLHSTWYLVSAGAIPLFAIAAVVFREELHAYLVLTGVVLTGLGGAVAYFAHRTIEDAISQYAKVLGNPERELTV
jgi:eukaryotic-like serine/threonine-protein kinase